VASPLQTSASKSGDVRRASPALARASAKAATSTGSRASSAARAVANHFEASPHAPLGGNPSPPHRHLRQRACVPGCTNHGRHGGTPVPCDQLVEAGSCDTRIQPAVGIMTSGEQRKFPTLDLLEREAPSALVLIKSMPRERRACAPGPCSHRLAGPRPGQQTTVCHPARRGRNWLIGD